MSTKCLSILPVAAAFFLLAAALGSYLIAFLHKDNIDFLPYPSDLGVEQPERGVFSVGLAFGGSITFAVVLLRFIQVNTFYPRVCFKSNIISFISGFMMLIGLYIVPAFPLNNHPIIHYVGAGTHFFFMILFMTTQAYVTIKHPYNHTKCIGHLRLALAILAFICPVMYGCGRAFAPKDEKRYYIPQASEWMLSLLFLIYICSFSWDFSRIHLRLNSYEVSPRSPDTRKLVKRPRNSESTM